MATGTVSMTTSDVMKLVDAVQGTSLAALWHGINLHQGREPVQTSAVPLRLFEQNRLPKSASCNSLPQLKFTCGPK
jgi:hypothetical protein